MRALRGRFVLVLDAAFGVVAAPFRGYALSPACVFPSAPPRPLWRSRYSRSTVRDSSFRVSSFWCGIFKDAVRSLRCRRRAFGTGYAESRMSAEKIAQDVIKELRKLQDEQVKPTKREKLVC